MPRPWKVCLIGCGRMGATIDDEARGRPNSERWIPYSHAAGYAAVESTVLVAVSDTVIKKAEAAAERYNVPHVYADYREMIETEQPDIVSVATRPTPHCEIVCFLAEHGVAGIYCEKPLARSMAEADRMLEACRQHGVKLNHGTQRRYAPLGRKIRAMVDSGELGTIECVVGYCGTGGALWCLTHATDMLLCFAGDPEVEFVQGMVNAEDDDWDGNALTIDPGITSAHALFTNGVHGYLVAGSGYEFEVCGTAGKIRTLEPFADGSGCKWRKAVGTDLRDPCRDPLVGVPFECEVKSGTVCLIEDLVDAIENDRETLGNIRLAHRSFEISMAVIESHRQGGARVPMPMANRTLYVGPDW